MSFASNSLSVLAYANGFTMWHYRSQDLSKTINAENYFNAATNMVRVGDQIHVNAADSNYTLFCTANDGATMAVGYPGAHIEAIIAKNVKALDILKKLTDACHAADARGDLPHEFDGELIDAASAAIAELEAANG